MLDGSLSSAVIVAGTKALGSRLVSRTNQPRQDTRAFADTDSQQRLTKESRRPSHSSWPDRAGSSSLARRGNLVAFAVPRTRSRVVRHRVSATIAVQHQSLAVVCAASSRSTLGRGAVGWRRDHEGLHEPAGPRLLVREDHRPQRREPQHRRRIPGHRSNERREQQTADPSHGQSHARFHHT